ncbi:hypothetical protein ICV01_04230 [Polynucleobacter sp. MWH-Spelu-300-X4]|uniref:hypothetical protein n=1 Tax=Polynucleobacter sp. MWH-Spelu-300-X4 TaxID=2689109 RepID=UPI001BFCDD26|nr:hypothetical protein [Polynucleobacter sp. MWH-Spelu-300-X4]QWD80520.1 hypothetical protein ICV01_04230 [Polynucleobacter sp. MWH-Spelu-300-X4]
MGVPSAWALNWVFNGQSNDNSRFAVDIDSLDYSTSMVRYMYRHDPGSGSKKTPNGLNYAYISSQYVADCSVGTSQETSRNYMEEKGWLVATGTPNSQPIILSQNPNGIHTVLVNALCFLSKSGVRPVDLSLFMDWTDDVAFNPGNDPKTALSRYVISPQSMQRKGDLLFFTQSLTYVQTQYFGDRPYKVRVAVGAFNCRTEDRSPLLLSMYYQDLDQRAIGWSGVQNPENFIAFARYENTEKFRRYCAKFYEPRPYNQSLPSPSKPIPVAPMPSKPVEEERKKTPPVRSDSLL